ncbi:hypothetical protein RIF29_17149 [Crotalaria pallida]|uniref:Uncharacterized protein n=1 Tax=Crotalaria pallida TaxID=3830 RepID=A0AAN9FQ03_CROPI
MKQPQVHNCLEYRGPRLLSWSGLEYISQNTLPLSSALFVPFNIHTLLPSSPLSLSMIAASDLALAA